jgi:hypothetical protein
MNRPLKEGGPWGKHGFPHGSEALCSVLGQSPRTRREKQGASDAHGTDPSPGTNGGLWKNGTRFSQSRTAWRWISEITRCGING